MTLSGNVNLKTWFTLRITQLLYDFMNILPHKAENNALQPDAIVLHYT
jgi:hypothetical protein